VLPGWSVYLPPTQLEHCSVTPLSILPATHAVQVLSSKTWPALQAQSVWASLPVGE